jgi:glycosyltransferase involved in cell wall biosynthesis
MPPIRVCAITCDSYPEDPLVRRTAEAAAANDNIEYHVICSMRDNQPAYELFNRVHVHRIFIRGEQGEPLGRITAFPFRKTVALWSYFTFLASYRIAKLHFKLNFDIVHVHNLPDFLVFSALAPKLLGAQVILHVQDTAPELMAAKSKGAFRSVAVALAALQERLSTSFANHVVTVGWPFEKPLLDRGVPSRKLSSILNSADPAIFSPAKRTPPFLGTPTAERPIVLMYHGTQAERNGLGTAIRAYASARLSAPHLRLHLKGGGDANSQLRELAESLRVTDGVRFFPSGPLEGVADFVVAGDIGIIPYPSDGFMNLILPTKSYEYAWMHRPMIASNTEAIRSLFRPDSVRLCEPSNVDSFAEAIVDLYWHPHKRAALVAAAERDYIQYRWELMADRYRSLIISMAGKKAMGAELKRSPEQIQ